MDLLRLTQSFVERCERAAPAAELTSAFQSALEHMGFRLFACCSHVNPERPPLRAVVIHNYPRDWVLSYAERNLHQCDPVFQHAEREILPFFWDAPNFRASLTPSQTMLVQEAADIGIAHGYTVPIHLPWTAGGLRASCSVVPDSNLIDTRSYHVVQLMSVYLYGSVSSKNNLRAARDAGMQGEPALSVRERQCLELVAYGKSDWEISRLLHISEHTVHKHVEAAKRRLGVSTRMQAVVWAVQRREISLGDVVQASPENVGAISRRFLRRPAAHLSKPTTRP